MAITGIDTIDGKQIIAAGAVSAKSAEMAYNDENGNPITGYLTAVPEGYATTGDLTAYQTTAGMTAYQSAGDYYSASNPSGFITGVDLTPYQTIEGMTAYQPVGYYLTTGDSANFYTTANESGFISEVPDTYLQNTDLTITDGKVTEISGVPLSAGDEFPQSATEAIETVTANSADWNATTDTVSSNSGAWGGSALPISAGPGIKFEIVNDTLVASTDETVLFETDSPSGVSAVTCSETIKNFERIAVLPSRFASNLGGGTGPYLYYETKWLTTGADTVNTIEPMIFEYLFWKISKYSANNDFTQFVWNGGFEVQQDTHTYRDMATCNVGIKKIVGINRIAGGN